MIKALFDGKLHELYACFYLSTDLVMVWWGNSLLFSCLQDCLTWNCAACDTIFFGSPNSANTIQSALIRLLEKGHLSSSQGGICHIKIQCTIKSIILIVNTSAPTTSWGLYGIPYGIVFSCGCICWYPMHVAHCSALFSMSVFRFIQYNDSHA